MTTDPGAASFPDAAPARHTGRCGIPWFPDPRRVFRIRRCGPLEYGLRVLAELAAVPASLAITEWVWPLFRLRSFRPQPFTSWPQDWRPAFVAALCALAVLDIALLRLAPKGRPAVKPRREDLTYITEIGYASPPRMLQVLSSRRTVPLKPVRDLTLDEQRAACVYTERHGDRLVYVNGVTGLDMDPGAMVAVADEEAS